jgi:hypothetical protein
MELNKKYKRYTCRRQKKKSKKGPAQMGRIDIILMISRAVSPTRGPVSHAPLVPIQPSRAWRSNKPSRAGPRSEPPAPYVRAHYSDTRPIQLSAPPSHGFRTYSPQLTRGPKALAPRTSVERRVLRPVLLVFTWRAFYCPGLKSVRRVRRSEAPAKRLGCFSLALNLPTSS